jgi:mRNA-degrading endonuclease RelE of RelBE toxin-antitoxin system
MYKLFIDILYGENKAKMKLKGILSLSEQLDFEQFKEIHGRCKRIDHRLSQYLMKIENGGYFKGKISLYVILDSWVSKDENKESFKPDYSPTFTAIE